MSFATHMRRDDDRRLRRIIERFGPAMGRAWGTSVGAEDRAMDLAIRQVEQGIATSARCAARDRAEAEGATMADADWDGHS